MVAQPNFLGTIENAQKDCLFWFTVSCFRKPFSVYPIISIVSQKKAKKAAESRSCALFLQPFSYHKYQNIMKKAGKRQIFTKDEACYNRARGGGGAGSAIALF